MKQLFKSIFFNTKFHKTLFLCSLIFGSFIHTNYVIGQDNIEICSNTLSKEQIATKLDFTFEKLLQSKSFKQINLKKSVRNHASLGEIYYYKLYVDKILLIQINYLADGQMLYGRHYIYCSKDELSKGICEKHEELFEYNFQQDTCTEILKNTGNKIILFMKDLLQNPPTITTLMNKKRFIYPPIIEFKTDRPTTCKFDTKDIGFEKMKFSTNNKDELLTIHKYCYESGIEGHNSIYIKCVDINNNTNLISKVIDFDIINNIGFDEKNLKADLYYAKINNKNVSLSYKQFLDLLEKNYNKDIFLALLENGETTELNLFFDQDNPYYKNNYKKEQLNIEKSKCSLEKKLIFVQKGFSGNNEILSGNINTETPSNNHFSLATIYDKTIKNLSIATINYIAPDVLKDGNTALSDLLKLMIQIFIIIIYLIIIVFVFKLIIKNYKIIFLIIPYKIFAFFKKNIQKSFNNKLIQNKTISNIIKFIRINVIFVLLLFVLNYLFMKLFSIKYYENLYIYLGMLISISLISISALLYPIFKTRFYGYQLILNLIIINLGILGSGMLLILLTQNLDNFNINFLKFNLFNISIFIVSSIIIILLIWGYGKFNKNINNINISSILVINNNICTKLIILSIIIFPIVFMLMNSIQFIHDNNFIVNYQKFLIKIIVNYQYTLLLILSGFVINLSILLLDINIKGKTLEKGIIIGSFNSSLINLYLIINAIILNNVFARELFLAQILFYFIWSVLVVFSFHKKSNILVLDGNKTGKPQKKTGNKSQKINNIKESTTNEKEKTQDKKQNKFKLRSFKKNPNK